MQKQNLLKLSKVSDVSQGKGYLLCCRNKGHVALNSWFEFKLRKGGLFLGQHCFGIQYIKNMRVGSRLNQKTGGGLV